MPKPYWLQRCPEEVRNVISLFVLAFAFGCVVAVAIYQMKWGF